MKHKSKPRIPRPIDPVLPDVLSYISRFTPSELSRASDNTVGASTIANWRSGKTRSPLNYTLDAALQAAGFERRIVKRK